MTENPAASRLKVRVLGPGFGESILLSWVEQASDEKTGEQRMALIDACGQFAQEKSHSKCSGNQWMEQLLKHAEDARFAFLACTHPHLDHIGGMANALMLLKGRFERVFWWGVPDIDRYDWMFDRLERMFEHKQDDGGQARFAARTSSAFLSMLKAAKRSGIEVSGDLNGIREIYSAPLPSSDDTIRVWTIGPVREQKELFQKKFQAQQDDQGRITPRYYRANRTSLGFLIQYGKAQVVLCGDMEEKNWENFPELWDTARQNDPTMPLLQPHLVKVAHHASSTGNDTVMWPAHGQNGWGFFGKAGVKGAAPLCIVTPWNCAPMGSRLPDNKVLLSIAAAGCRIFCSGSASEGIVSKERLYSEVSVCLLADGKVEAPELIHAHEWQPFAASRAAQIN